MTVAIAVVGEEDVSPMMACTCAGLVQGSSEGADTISFPLVKVRATRTLLAMEPQVS